MTDSQNIDPILAAIAEQERLRLSKVVERDKGDRPSAYLGYDQASGEVLMRPLGSAGVLQRRPLTNTQPSMGQQGLGGLVGFGTQNVRVGDDEIFDAPNGEVAVLAVVQVTDDTWQIWLGGDRVNPALIIDNLPKSPSATLELLGPGKSDWIVTYRYGSKSTSTIGVRYGKEDRDKNRTDWEITSPVCDILSYQGLGFWCSGAKAYSYGTWATTEAVPNPDMVNPPGLGYVEKSDYQHTIGGYTTIAIEHYRTYTFIGNPSVTAEGYERRIGFDQNAGFGLDFPYSYTGINEQISTRVVTGEWEGETQGPGSVGEGGANCVLGSAPLTGTAKEPNKKVSSRDSFRLQVQTQSYSFSLQLAVITASVGTHSLYQDREIITNQASGGGFREYQYRGQCQHYIDPIQDRWSISGYGSATGWPSVPYSSVTTATPMTSSYSNEIVLAPNLNKEFKFNAVTVGSNLQATAEYYSPALVFDAGQGKSYAKIVQSGNAEISTIYGSFPRFLLGSNSTTQHYLIYKGIEIQLQAALETVYTVWRDLLNDPYPTGYKANYQDYARLPNGTIKDLEQNNVFIKSKVLFSIDKLSGRLVSNKVTYDVVREPKTRKALSMKKVQAIAKVGTKAIAADIKYWAKN
jgi:hypothetical protein